MSAVPTDADLVILYRAAERLPNGVAVTVSVFTVEGTALWYAEARHNRGRIAIPGTSEDDARIKLAATLVRDARLMGRTP